MCQISGPNPLSEHWRTARLSGLREMKNYWKYKISTHLHKYHKLTGWVEQLNIWSQTFEQGLIQLCHHKINDCDLALESGWEPAGKYLRLTKYLFALCQLENITFSSTTSLLIIVDHLKKSLIWKKRCFYIIIKRDMSRKTNVFNVIQVFWPR